MNNCLVCTSPNTSFLYKVRSYNIRRCDDCSVGFISPLPERDTLKKIYEKVHGNGDYTAGRGRYVNYADPAVVRSREVNFERNLATVVSYNGSNHPKRLLEIGCASGLFLSMASRYFDEVLGIDLAENAVGQVPQILNGSAACGSLEDFKFEPGSFHCIALFDTFEHLLDPRGTLQSISRLLDPKAGVLVMTTPDAGSLNARLFGRHWRLLLPPLHVTYFSQQAMTNILEMSGMEVLSMTNPSGYVAFKHLTYMINVMLGYRIPQALLGALSHLPGQDQLVPVNFGDIMLVVARKQPA